RKRARAAAEMGQATSAQCTRILTRKSSEQAGETMQGTALKNLGGPHDGDTPPDTRQRILEIAQREISEHGIDGVSIRTIARLAGVDPRLVRHYFGSKEGLLLHAVQIGDDPHALAQHVAAGNPRTLGRHAARTLLRHWDDPRMSMPYRARLSAALTN